jgi:hypothetical protein
MAREATRINHEGTKARRHEGTKARRHEAHEAHEAQLDVEHNARGLGVSPDRIFSSTGRLGHVFSIEVRHGRDAHATVKARAGCPSHVDARVRVVEFAHRFVRFVASW